MSETSETSAPSGKLERLDLVIRSLRRTRNKLGCGFVFILGFGIAAIVGGIVSDEAGIGAVIVGVVCVLLSALGAKIIWPNLKPAESPLVKLLLEHPEKIAWIYTAMDPGSGGVWGKTVNVNVNDTDKKAYSFSAKAKELDQMMETLTSFAPRAAVGMTDEIKKKYFQDPWSVMADAETKDV
ncbi:MAG: hypothetical protein ACYSU0_08330 [Planctomycetota bacterium]|jgi:hypothetical protein